MVGLILGSGILFLGITVVFRARQMAEWYTRLYPKSFTQTVSKGGLVLLIAIGAFFTIVGTFVILKALGVVPNGRLW
jgi:hypothetical protein